MWYVEVRGVPREWCGFVGWGGRLCLKLWGRFRNIVDVALKILQDDGIHQE